MIKSIKIVLPIIFALGALLSSCSKKNDDPTPVNTNPNTNTNPNNPNTNPNNPNTNPNNPTITSGDYLPLTAGNIWNYGGDNTYTTRVTSKTKTINNKLYTAMTQGDPSDPEPDTAYGRRDGNKYYTYSPTTPYGPLELKIIDLDLSVGTSWTAATIQSNEATIVTYKMKVTDTDLSRTVNTIAYKDVISVQLSTTIAMDPIYKQKLINLGVSPSVIAYQESQYAATVLYQTTYYAKNIGVIEQTSDTQGLNIHLVSSVIK